MMAQIFLKIHRRSKQNTSCRFEIFFSFSEVRAGFSAYTQMQENDIALLTGEAEERQESSHLHSNNRSRFLSQTGVRKRNVMDSEFGKSGRLKA